LIPTVDISSENTPFILKPYPNDEEDTCKNCGRHNPKHLEQGTCHCAYNRQSHDEMRHSLFYNSYSSHNRFSDFSAFALLCLDDVDIRFVYCERVCMDGSLSNRSDISRILAVSTYLWYQPIRHRKTKNSRDKRSTPQKEKIPMETARFLQWKLACLCRQAANILQESQLSFGRVRELT
jgi:hypothetical protein